MKNIENLSTPAPTYNIYANYGYIVGTYNAPSNGKMLDRHADRMVFGTLREAYDHLTAIPAEGYYEPDGPMGLNYDGKGTFYPAGRYDCSHGQHSRPNYQIINAKSGRCNKSIIAELAKLTA